MTPDSYRTERKKRGTQQEVAALLGVMQSTISDRETGRRAVTREAELALLSLPISKGKLSENVEVKHER
jgi:transcriptional regulator with XRE-family HTH domain